MSPTVVCPLPLAPLGVPCEGGICVSALECACPGDRMGQGDFILGAPSCTLNFTAVRALWAACACVYVAALPMAVFYFYRIKNATKYNRRKVVYGFFASLQVVCLLIVCTMRAAHPDTTAIGTYAPTTVVFAMGAFSFWIQSIIFTLDFVDMHVRQSRIKDQRTKQHIADLEIASKRIFPLLVFFDAAACCAVIGMLGVTESRWTMFGLALIHYALLAAVILTLGVFMLPRLVRPIIKDLIEASRALKDNQQAGGDANEAFRQIARKMEIFLNDLRVQGMANFVGAVLFGCWPMLQSFSSYWLPIAWISAGVIVITTLYAEAPVSVDRQRLSSPLNTGGTNASTHPVTLDRVISAKSPTNSEHQ